MQNRYRQRSSKQGVRNDENVLVIGGYIANFAENKLQIRGVWLTVESELMQMLRCLVKACGKVVSKAELNEFIWPDCEMSDTEMTYKISQLRKLLECDAESPSYIKTVSGEGYLLLKKVLRLNEA